jgi:hypothetical protein
MALTAATGTAATAAAAATAEDASAAEDDFRGAGLSHEHRLSLNPQRPQYDSK